MGVYGKASGSQEGTVSGASLSLFFTQIAGSGNCKCSILTLKTDIVKQNPSSPLAVTVNIRDIRSDAIQSLVNVLTLLVYSNAACRMAPYSSVESGSF